MRKFLITISVVIVVACLGFIVWARSVLLMPNSSTNQLQQVVIPTGASVETISQKLAAAGLIRDAKVFYVYTWLVGHGQGLKAGSYTLPTNLTMIQLLDRLQVGGVSRPEITLTFIEGWDTQDIAAYLVKQGIIIKEAEFLDAIKTRADWWNDYQILRDKPRDVDLEGYLFPDTYRFYTDTSVQNIIKTMVATMDKRFTPEVRAEINARGKTVHDILTLASIVEKEVGHVIDQKQVAGIFYNRLNIGMPLQSDATVNYITRKNTTRPSGKDISVDDPYNTYKNKGLPPGPISSPSWSAIDATIHPTANPYYYFLTTPAGQAIYSKTHDEHVAAKAKYY